MFTIHKDTPITSKVVQRFLTKHQYELLRLKKLDKAYLGDHEILHLPPKDKNKPDNRIVNNFAKYIVDTFTGFFNGIPVSTTVDNETAQNTIDYFNKLNDAPSLNYELIKYSAIFGRAFEFMYQNEEADTKSVAINPLNAFVVYDKSVEHNPVFGVRYELDSDTQELYGEVYTNDTIYSITGVNLTVDKMTEVTFNPYGQLPLIEYRFNTEEQGIFENVLTEINNYNKALSEKANDIDYFSDAYLVLAGAEFDSEDLPQIRDNRLLVLHGSDYESPTPTAQFLSKPDADTSQENLLNRLERNIFHTSMVANITDEDFGNASGISLRYKLLSMENLAKTVERQIKRSMLKRYELLFSLATNIPTSMKDEYKEINFTFTRNLPTNLLEEADMLNKLDGQVSDESKLALASFIENPKEELDRLTEQKEENMKLFDFQKVNEGVEDESEETSGKLDTE